MARCGAGAPLCWVALATLVSAPGRALAAPPAIAPPADASTPLARELFELLQHGNVTAALQLGERRAAERAPVPMPPAGLTPPGDAPPSDPDAAQSSGIAAVAWPPAEAAVVSHLLGRLGRWESARTVVRRCASGKRADIRCVRQLAEVEKMAGSGPARLAVVMAGLRVWPGDAALALEAGDALLETGKDPQARRLLDPLVGRYENGQFKEPGELACVARALHRMGYVRDANRVFQEALEAAADLPERATVERGWGALFLDKYNWKDADKAFRSVLQLDASDPDATIGMARVDIASDHDIRRARSRLDRLLIENPRHWEALVARAEVALHDEDWSAARSLLDRARALRPDAPRLLHVDGALARLTDDAGGWQRAEQAARKVNPDDGRLYLVAATWLEQAHRYRETMELLGTAIERAPDLWPAHAMLGVAHARLGDDAQAVRHLQEAWRGDPFDVRTTNQLNVLYDGVLKQMVILRGPKVDLRVHRKDRKALERTVLPFLQESLGELEKKYAMTAEKPLLVEVFPEVDQFSVRTVGLPRLGAHAVCFGHLITSRSPVAAPFNWKMVLRHELAHVFHIRMTEGRVPRWLTEGIAMMESTWADPRWQVRMDRRAYDRWQAGRLAQLARFNLAFSQARSMGEIVDAYYQSMLLAEYLAETHGFDKLRALVAGHGPGRATPDVVRAVLGVEPAEVDRRFETWLGTRLGRYARDFRPTLASVKRDLANAAARERVQGAARDLGEAAAATARAGTAESDGEPDGELDGELDGEPDGELDGSGADDPADDKDAAALDVPAEVSSTAAAQPSTTPHRARLERAVAALAAGRGPPAWEALAAGVTQAGDVAKLSDADRLDVCRLRFFWMQLASAKGDATVAREQAEALVATPGCDGVATRMVLFGLLKKAGAAGGAVGHLTAAWRLDPTDPGLAQAWVEVVGLAARTDASPATLAWRGALAPDGSAAALRRPLREALAIEPNDSRPALLLAQLAWAAWSGPAPLDRGAARTDLMAAARALEESDPAGRASVLYEARSQVASGADSRALVPYRLAAERAAAASERAEAWCELAAAAGRAGARDEEGEARRRCEAERMGAVPGGAAR